MDMATGEVLVSEPAGIMWMGGMLNTGEIMLDSNEEMEGECEGDQDYYGMSPNSLDSTRSNMKLELDSYMMLEDYDHYGDVTNYLSVESNSVDDSGGKKIKPFRHPGLKLKTPITYEKDTDPSVIPIKKEGMAVCQKCGAIGVKHAFYTKERRFCSLLCSREHAETEKQAERLRQEQYVPGNSDSSEDVKLKDMMCSDMLGTGTLPEPPSINLPPLDEPLTPPDSKRFRIEIPQTYEWKTQLSEPGFIAAPVTCFRHAPIADIWDNISVGMKVEVENTDCDDFSECFPDSFWVATVLQISGYMAKLRYEGFGLNSTKDFWVNLCASSVHPVGWCATRGKPLIPPKTIEDKYKDWKDFLVKRLTGARTLPTNFYQKVNESMTSRFRPGMNLEVVDKNRISQMKVASIQKIVGKRLHVRYQLYNRPIDDGFWIHEDSPLIHPVGWSLRVGHELDAHPQYLQRLRDGERHPDDATDDLFLTPEAIHHPSGVKFCEGMLLEAIDPLNLSAICVATVMKVLREDYILVKIDCYEEDDVGKDYFCFHVSSPCIFPAGFCDLNDIPLNPPKGNEPSEFCWESYLHDNNYVTAPVALFTREIPDHGFTVGMRVEATDVMQPQLVCVGTVCRVIGRLLKIHFDGWDEEFDQWMDCESPDIYPVGWCELVGQKLEGPPPPEHKTTFGSKHSKVVKKKPRRRRKYKSSPNAPTTPKKSPNPSALPLSIPIALQFSNDDSSISDEKPQTPPPRESVSPSTVDVEEEPEAPCPVIIEKLETPSLVTKEKPEAPCLVTKEPAIVTKEPVELESSQPQPEPSIPVPRERPATSYINQNNGSSGKLIPRLIDLTPLNSPTWAPGELAPVQWNVFDVAQFLRVNDCATYCDSFSKKKIDGKMLLELTKDQIVDLTGGKVGPSLKIYDLIQQLKLKVNPAQERMRLAALKKYF